MNAGFSYTDSNPFPKELKNYFQGNSETEDSHKLESFFDNNPSVKKAFVEWTRGHQSLVEYTPRLYRALELATANEEYEVLAKSINSLYLAAFGNKSAKKILPLAKGMEHDDELPDTFLKDSLELYGCGIIDKSELSRLIDYLQNYKKKHNLKRQFEKGIPDLRQVDDLDILYKIFSVTDSIGCTLLNYPEIVEKLIPFLMELNPESIFKLVGSYQYMHPNIREMLFPVLCKLRPNQLFHVHESFFDIQSSAYRIHFLSLEDYEGKKILDHPEHSKFLKAFLEKKSESELKILCNTTPLIKFIIPILAKNNKQINEAVSILKLINLKSITPEESYLLFLAPYGEHHAAIVKKLMPALEELPAQQLISLLSIRNVEGYTLLHYKQGLDAFLPILRKLEPNQLCQALTRTNSKGDAVFHSPVLISLLVPLLDSLPTEQLVPLFFVRNSFGATIVHYSRVLLPILRKLEPDQLYQVLTMTDRAGRIPLHSPLLELLAPLLNHLNGLHFISLLLTKDNGGLTPLDRPESFQLILPLIIQKLELHECMKILSSKIKNDKPLLDTANFRLVLPYLSDFSAEDLNSLFSIQYLHGDTLLHNPQIYQLSKPLFSKLNPKVFEIKNNEGISVQESATNRSSMKWLTKEKEGINAKSLSEDEYKTKAAELKTAFNALWGTFVFGSEEGEVPAEYLETKEKIHSPEDLEIAQKLIKQKLDIMIDKIADLTPWVGTPPENQKEALLQFYSLMLLNFERIFELWKTESNPVVKAGTLIDLAKIELAGRCAAAYQSEIEQTKMILESTHNTQSKAENTSMDSAFTKIAQACLVKCIETVVQQKHQGDSHNYSQFLYSVGLQAVPDPLAKLTVDACHNEIIDEWTVAKIVHDFLAGFQHMDFDTALYWFQQVTPDEFGQELLAHLPKVEAMEQQYLKEASEQLGGNLAAAMVFQSPEGANLKPLAQLPLRKFVSETVYNQLKEASSLADMEAIEIQQKMDMESLSNRRREVAATIANLRKITAESRNEAQEKELQAAVKEQSTLQQTFIGIANEFNRMKTGTIHKIKLKELLEKSGVSLSSMDLSRVIEAKKTYDEKVSGLVDELDINFNPEQGSLSNALKYNRKLEFAKQFFTNNKLNASGALFILNRIGVIEHQI